MCLLPCHFPSQARKTNSHTLTNLDLLSRLLEEEEEEENLNLTCNGRPHLSDPAQPDAYFCSGMRWGGRIRSEYYYIRDQIRSREGRSLGLPPVNGIGTDSSFSSKWGGEVDAVAQPSLPLPLF